MTTKQRTMLEAMFREGRTFGQISRATGLTAAVVRGYCIKHLGYKLYSSNGQDRFDAHSTADASVLTEEQLETCRRQGIKPERMAWVLSCPKSGNAYGWKGGNAIG